MKIAIILGTRPEIIKLSPVIRQCQKSNIDFFIIHSNQHYSPEMDKIFFSELKLPQPKYNLNVGSGLHGEMTAKILIGTEKILLKELPDWVLVQGDTNTILAGALAASKLQIKVGHVEAGLRSYDRTMPEETNRIITDHISDALFVPTQNQKKILLKEGIEPRKIFVTGNTIVDAIIQNLKLISPQKPTQKYFLLTLHRPSNVDDAKKLNQIIKSLESVSQKYKLPFIFPIHPRTKQNLKFFKINLNPKYFSVLKPLSYLEMLYLEKNATLIFTDSGGIQEEACILKIPCVTIRDNTERPETIKVGANTLASATNLSSRTKKMLKIKRDWPNPFGAGQSSLKILKIITS
ncbi:MAG: UDP-N-acetylglucosamine 2-epimerase (non-hydrolyzing) [Patescibacteria group bacterium]